MASNRVAMLALVAGAMSLSAAIAIGTPPGIHPDEGIHLAGFAYFEGRLWPPTLDSDQVRYDPYGTSKVYSLEVVYVIFGNLVHALQAVSPLPPALWYRFLNLAMFPLAFLPLLLAKGGPVPLRSLGIAIIALPQVLYVFGYANSDAFGVTVTLCLFAWAARLASVATPWALKDALVLGLLVGLTLGAKPNYALGLILPAALLAPHLRRGLRLSGLLVVALLAVLVAAPLKVAYPLTQEAPYSSALYRMRQKRAAEGFRGLNPTDSTVRLAQRGVSLQQVVIDRGFAVRTAQSFWGVYGHMNVFNPKAVYLAVGALGLLNLALTLSTTVRAWSRLPQIRRRLLLLSPVVLAPNLAVSLWLSYYQSFQPQGRYVFPSLIPVALLLAGTTDLEPSPLRRIRRVSVVVLIALGAWSLLGVALPRLSP